MTPSLAALALFAAQPTTRHRIQPFPTRHNRHANTPCMASTNSGSTDYQEYPRMHLASVLSTASRSAPANRERVALPLGVVTFQCVASLLAIVVLAGLVAAQLDNLCFPARDSTCSASSLQGVVYGFIGAAVLRGAEAWQHRDAPSDARDEYRDGMLRQAVLVGTLPLQLLAWYTVADDGVAEEHRP